MGIRSQLEGQPGYQEYRELSRRTPFKDYPWGMIAANIAGITAAHAAGYYTAGALSQVLMKSPMAKSFGQIAAPRRRMLLAHLVGAAGTAGAAAAGLASVAGQARIAERLSRSDKQKQVKAAHVLEIYRLAVDEFPL